MSLNDYTFDNFRRYMYNKITKESALLWCNPIIEPKDKTSLINRCLRSNSKEAKNDQFDVKTTDSFKTYGEATIGSIRNLISSMVSIGISDKSIFIDIGSGFGKVVFDVAVSTHM